MVNDYYNHYPPWWILFLPFFFTLVLSPTSPTIQPLLVIETIHQPFNHSTIQPITNPPLFNLLIFETLPAERFAPRAAKLPRAKLRRDSWLVGSASWCYWRQAPWGYGWPWWMKGHWGVYLGVNLVVNSWIYVYLVVNSWAMRWLLSDWYWSINGLLVVN